MKHVLDNPVWNALISGNKNLAEGGDSIKYFSAGISPFVGLKKISGNNLRKLYEIMDMETPVGIVHTKEIFMPGFEIVKRMEVLQMVYNNPAPVLENEQPFVPLQDKHIPEMLALTQLTNPGPFLQKTIAFGDFYGIFHDDKLVAMCGQRLHPDPYLEVSAVCTHPGHHGKGYATQLILHQLSRIKKKFRTPFLHVKSDNEKAINLYKKLGFRARKELTFTVFQKIP